MHALTLAFIASAFLIPTSPAEKPPIVCKTPALAPACFTLHGRLQFGNGTPALRLWQIGTHHEFGIYSGLNAEKVDPGDNEHPQLPANLERVLKQFDKTIYADFEVCPLEPPTPGHMQAACIASASRLHVVK